LDNFAIAAIAIMRIPAETPQPTLFEFADRRAVRAGDRGGMSVEEGERGDGCGWSRPQNLQTIASSWIISAQYGHFFTVASHFEVLPLPP
jgi:hypothetical protein